ncbi:Laminin subunit alpha-3 [Liparis tanakae]|uniref:Laminin subunit alpha-3 n=1 Tax=Liparis tanakae TaxID=230148 RepID=A0A4Z2HLZ0_9TELE|nr:Laminin subunit alpha-3 [Liparis tanakae]
MDGAKTDLTKKVNEIANAAAKKSIVEAAEEHAKNLAKLAKELENAVKDASSRPEVQNAKDAIDAYKNITDANLNKQKLTQRATDLKETSDDLLKNAKEAEKDLQDAAADLIDLKKRLDAAGTKKNALQNDLLGVQDALNNINIGDVRDMIDDAKNRAASANNSATDTMNKLDDIKKEIDKINISPVNSNLNLDDVEKSVKNLIDTIPSLNDKLSEVENLTSQFSTLSNISENIKKMKELIEQARDAANRIVVPMNFLGNGHVEMRAPKNLEDLKAYTSLSLSLQRPEGRGDGRRRRRQAAGDGDMFVLYLGNKDSSKNYMGLVLRANVLYGVYKLNGVEYSIESGSISKSAPEPAQFDRVDLQRIYQDVQMNLTKDITSNDVTEPIVKNNKGEESKNLLDISPSDVVFYVGGYPDDFVLPASLDFPKYKGCIEFFSVNDKIVSLYNFEKAEKINEKVPCKRYARPLDSSYYEGTGYGKVLIDKASNLLLISMSLYSRSENGLLMYIGSEDDYFTVTIEKGFVVIRSNLQAAPAISTKKSFPTTDWADMLIIRTSSGKMTVRLSNKEVVTAQATFDNKEFKELYIGGAPQEMREKHNITILPYKGCLKNMKLNKDFKPITDPVGISKGCPMDSLVTRKAEFSLGSALTSDLKGFSLANDVTVSLGFKSTENQGLILQGQQPGQRIDLTLENGHVMLHFGKIWKSNEQYNDGHWHFLTITRRGERVTVIIDDEDTGRELGDSNAAAPTGDAFALGKNTFRGCISNLYTRRSDNLYRPEDFSNFHTSGGVLLDVCTADTLPQLMLDRAAKKDVAMQPINDARSAPHFSLDVRTRAPEGLLFFVATRGGRSHLALYISKGRIRLSVGKQKEIFNREKYNDGKWHSIIFSLEKKKFRLVVDGIRAQDGLLTNAELTSMQQFVSPVYLGSAPESLHRELKLKALPKQSVSGCIRNFKMNGAPMSNPTTNHGAGPCFEGQTQRGAYFSGNGAHVILNDSFIVGSSFELLFNIRPRSPTGLLLHVGDSSWNQYGPVLGHYLTVVAQANNGKGEFRVSVKPKVSLCDGTFHKISVIKRMNVVQLHVDTIDHYKIGPPSPSIPLTKDSLYVGGIPEMAMQQALPVTSSFVGCIQDMRINGDSVSFDRPSGVFGPVNLKECPG